MLANAPKDNPISSADSCALYYFPEIRCGLKKDSSAGSSRQDFVRETLNQKRDGLPSRADLQDPDQVQSLIETAFNQGKDQGRAESNAAQQAKIDQATRALQSALDELTRIRQDDVERMEMGTVRLALAIAKKIIGDESQQGSIIGHVVKSALNKVADPRRLTVRLNPKDIDTVKRLKGDAFLFDDLGAELRLEADKTIQRGGCMIETNLGDVDARIDQQLKIIEEQLTAQFAKRSVKG